MFCSGTVSSAVAKRQPRSNKRLVIKVKERKLGKENLTPGVVLVHIQLQMPMNTGKR